MAEHTSSAVADKWHLPRFGDVWRDVTEWWDEFAIPLTSAYLLTLIVYSYFFTTIIFTDHTFPNAWVRLYPSTRTTLEGRWFADILLFVVGGVGVQAFQMALGVAIQIINAYLFARLLDVTNRFRMFLIAAFLSLHPAFLDYYSFTSDHVHFTFGDTLALLGCLALYRVRNKWQGIGIGALCFALTLATYQPKISLIVLLLFVLAMRRAALLDDTRPTRSTGGPARQLATQTLLPGALALVGAIGLYYLTLLATVSVDGGLRTNINSFGEMFGQLVGSYPVTLGNFTTRTDYLPPLLIFLPMLALLLGLSSVVSLARRRNWQLGLVVLSLIVLLPPTLQLSYIINNETFPFVGRIETPHAYLLVFALVSAWSVRRLSTSGTVLAMVFVYCFCIVGSQEANAAAMKTVFDFSKINRIVGRIESVAPELYTKGSPIVIVGELGLTSPGPFRKNANVLYKAHVKNEAFQGYSQDMTLNFFLGRDVISRPTKAQLDAAIASERGRRPWPAPESVYMLDGVIVVLLEPYAPGVSVTWQQ